MSNIHPHAAPTSEQWRPVVGYEGYYEVSDLGRLRSLPRILADGRHWKGREITGSANKSGHLALTICRDGVSRSTSLHTLVLEAFAGPCPPGQEACHWDDDPSNNALSNLRWDTRSANKKDAVRNGRNVGSKKSHCPRGHALEKPNLALGQLRRGWRQCRACQLARSHAQVTGQPFDADYANTRYEDIMTAVSA